MGLLFFATNMGNMRGTTSAELNDAAKFSNNLNAVQLSAVAVATTGPIVMATALEASPVLLNQANLMALRNSIMMADDLAFISSATIPGTPTLSGAGLLGFFSTTNPIDFGMLVYRNLVESLNLAKNKLGNSADETDYICK